MNYQWLLYLFAIFLVDMITSSPIISNPFLRKQTVSYPYHPYTHHNYHQQHEYIPSSSSSSRRNLLQEASSNSNITTVEDQIQDAIDDIWSNIRITPYFDYLDNTTGKTDYYTAYVLKHQISASIRYFEQFVKVVHTDKPLRLSKECEYIPDPNDPNDATKATQNCTTFCGDTNFVIPSEHLDTGWVVNNEQDECQVIDVDPPGLGIADTDLVVYVSNENYRCQGRSWQTVCEQDQFGRPTAILLNFCNVTYTEDDAARDYEDEMDLTMHELTHGLIFNRKYFGQFRNPINGDPVDEHYVIRWINDSFWIVSPEVQAVARKHFDCGILPGAMLDATNYHWSGRMLNTELMNNDGYYLYISKFTLALMKDSGWYRIDDYSYAEPFYFGYNAGCNFIYDDCIDKRGRFSNYRAFWCDSYDDIGCFYDYTRTSSKCLYYDDLDERNQFVPVEYQYFGFASIGGPFQTNYCPFLTPHDGVECINANVDTNGLDHTFEQTFGDKNSRCIQTNSGDSKLTAGCFDVYCLEWNDEMGGYEEVMITINDGVNININVTCYRINEGGVLNVVCPEGVECLSITCPYIDIMCGTTQKPFDCYYGHYSDILGKCICSPGYKGETCLNHDLGFEQLQLYSSSDPILITYYHTFCIYGLQWGDTQIVSNINGVWKIKENISESEQYNPVYIKEDNPNYIIYYTHCDETWNIKDTSDERDIIIGKCLHNRFEWTDYGALASCDGNWYFDHNLDGDYLRDINVKISTGDETEACNVLIHGVQPFADYEYICVQEPDGYFSGTYELYEVYNGYNSWRNAQYDEDNNHIQSYITFEGASWHLHPYTASIDDYSYICYTFDNDPISSCNGKWYRPNDYSAPVTLFIDVHQCPDDNFPTAPTPQTPEPSRSPTAAPIVPAAVISPSVCLSNAGGSFDGTYKANGTFNDKQIFIKEYLPQLNRPFVYLFYRSIDNSWIVYRDKESSDFWFLKCPVSSSDAVDIEDVATECDTKWITSWSGKEETILISTGDCDITTPRPTAPGITPYPTKKPTMQPITADEVNNNYMCVRGTTFDDLDGTYSYNGTFNNRSIFKKEYEPQYDKPWVYIKFEVDEDHYDSDIYGWIVYRKLNTQNYYFYCNISWANNYYETDHHEINRDPTVCNGHWVTNWYNGNNNISVHVSYGMCVEDVIVAETKSPTTSPIEGGEESSNTTECGSEAIVGGVKPNEFYYDLVCLNNVEDKSLAGIYRLNGTYNGYPAYIKKYLPDQDKPFVYIKFEDVIIGDIDNDGIIDTRRQWIVYREYCAQTYYLYCEHRENTSDINKCSGYWHTSWSGKEINITTSSDISQCNEFEEPQQQTATPPLAICMTNTETASLNGRYIKDGEHNGHIYYKKPYVLHSNKPYVYIKYEHKWMIYSNLSNSNRYFLECDGNIDSMDVTQCDYKWKGAPSATPPNVRSIDCSEITTEPPGIIEWPNVDTITAKQRRMVVIAGVILAFLFSVCLIACICKRKNGKKHRFNRLQDDDDNDSEVGIDGFENNESVDDDVDVTYLDHDENSIGGGTKQRISSLSSSSTTTTKKKKFTDVFKKKQNIDIGGGVIDSENVELVSSSNSNNDNDNDNDIDNDMMMNNNEEEQEDDDEEEPDEFTSELNDNDDDDDDDDEEENMLNAAHGDDNDNIDNRNNEEINSISYVSPHNRLEID